MELRTRKKLYISISLIALAIVITVSSVVYARYVNGKNHEDNQVKAENFYFTTDLFTEYDQTDRTIDVYGSANIPFSVTNYIDELRINSTDIKYNIAWTTLNGKNEYDSEITLISLTNEDNDPIAVSDDPSDLETHEVVMDQVDSGAPVKITDKYVLTIAPEAQYDNGDKIVITIKSTDGSSYTKTMTLTFVLHDFEHELFYYIEDNEINTKLVIMSNVDIAADKITIDWSDINTSTDADKNIFQVDITNQYILEKDAQGVYRLIQNKPEEGKSLNSCTVTQKVSSMQSFSIMFFKYPKDGVAFYCEGGTQKDPKGIDKDDNEEYTIYITKAGNGGSGS